MFKNAVSNLRKFDWVLLIAVFSLFCLGLAAIYSVDLSQETDAFSNFKKQIIFGVIGFCAAFVIGLGNYSGLRVYSKMIYVATLASLVAVLFFGSNIRGTTGWFSVFGLGIQPVEFAKVALIVMLAKFFSNRLQQFRVSKHIIVSLFITLTFVTLIMFQPDFGSSLILLGIWFLLLLLTGIDKKYILILVAISVVLAGVSWQFLLADYQKDRIITFVSPSSDPLGRGYNVMQAIIAIGSGNWFGRGLGFGSQSQLRFVPESQTDFVFAVIAEELGLFGVMLLLGFWAIVFYRLITIARRSKDDFGMFLVLGITCLLFLHIFINIGMNMGIMPVTGISLPFLSYGGSFLVICMALIGVAEGVAVKK